MVIRAAAGLVLLQPGFALVAIDIVLLHDRRVGHEEPGQHRVVRRERLEQVISTVVGSTTMTESSSITVGEHPGHAQVLAQHALEVVLHGLGGDGRPIVEGGVVGQLDGPGRGVGAADNFGRQQRLDFGRVAFIAQQAVVDRALPPGDRVVVARCAGRGC